MDRRQQGRPRRQRRAAHAQGPPAPAAQPAAFVVQAPFRLEGPVVQPSFPTEDEMFAANWGGGNPNHLTEKEMVGRRFMPLPPGAAVYESTFFEYKAEFSTEDDLANILMKHIYDAYLNEVGDKRREILHDQWRSSNKKIAARLKVELDELVVKLIGKMTQLTRRTNMVVPFPVYFRTFPALT